MIREYSKNDINGINVLGRDLSIDYLFKEQPYRKCIIYEANNNILGFITFDLLQDRAEILDIIVHINYRKQGIGEKLLNKAIELMLEFNIKRVSLEVRTSNKEAVSFYKKNNFKIITTRREYYQTKREDAYLMNREL